MAALPSSRRPRPLSFRKRISTARLSTDTTGSLPAYSSPTPPSGWAPPAHDDQPPDYPQSEEADQEDVDDFVPLRGPRSASHRHLRHRRSESASVPTSPSVDDLLERSVLALEMSTNALLQSMDTHSSLSAITNDRMGDSSLDRQTRMLDMRMRGSRNAHEGWMDDLEQVIKGVDGLFLENDPEAGVSRSLPTDDSPMRAHPRPRTRPSMHLPKSNSDSPYFHLSTSELDLRDAVRPPRALTQYVSVESASGLACEATADQESIFLPSTTGLRSAAQIRSFANGGPRAPRLRQCASSPGLDSSSSPSTSAYTMLSQLATQHSSRSPSRAASPPVSLPSPTSDTSRRAIRRYSAGSLDSTLTFTGLRRSRSNSRGRSSTSTETPPLPPVRAMTPPMEESTPSSSTSSLNAFRTMESLRKILDDAPADSKGKRSMLSPPRKRFLPRSPSVAPSSGTSTATASVSRLFTRSSHHGPHVTAHARHSSLKKTPAPTPPVPGTPSTAPSTPRNVSFAELPDSYSGRRKRRGKEREKGKEKARGRHAAWWSGWFSDIGGGGGGGGAARHDERMEDRVMRGWGRPGVGGGGAEEWMI